MGRRWPLTIKVKGLARPMPLVRRTEQSLNVGKVALHSQREVRAKGIDRATSITKEEQTSLECWKEVTPHSQSEKSE